MPPSRTATPSPTLPPLPVGLDALVDLDSIAELRPPGMRVEQVSSYDRSGGNVDFGVGPDTAELLRLVGAEPTEIDNSYLYRDGDRYVVFDELGPGVVYRIWMTGLDALFLGGLQGDIAFELDDEPAPRLQLPRAELFGGQRAPFVTPLAGDNKASSGRLLQRRADPLREAPAHHDVDRAELDARHLREAAARNSGRELRSRAPTAPPSPPCWPTSDTTRRKRRRRREDEVDLDVAPRRSAGRLGDRRSGRDPAPRAHRPGRRGDPARAAPAGVLRRRRGAAVRRSARRPVRRLARARRAQPRLRTRRRPLLLLLPHALPRGARLALHNQGEERFAGWRLRMASTTEAPSPRAAILHARSASARSRAGRARLRPARYRGHRARRRRGAHRRLRATPGAASSRSFPGSTAPISKATSASPIDGSRYPQIHGTGLEDFFNGGFYFLGGAVHAADARQPGAGRLLAAPSRAQPAQRLSPLPRRRDPVLRATSASASSTGR